MKIIKYSKGTKGKYKVYLENDTILTLYEEVILKYNLLIYKEIDTSIIDDIKSDNMKYEVYYVALNSIKSRIKSEYELKESLIRKEYPIDLINEALEKLTTQGYLNDRSYAKSFINNQIVVSSKGPLKIEKELLDKRIDSNIIQEELSVFDEELQLERIEKLVNKAIKSNHTRGGNVLKQKICNDLKNLGYEYSLISSVLANASFSNDNSIAKKEYEKLYRKYSRKYSGTELSRVIREKMYMKGLKYEEEE